MDDRQGLFYVLASWPIWQTILVFYLLTQFVVDAGRELFEGFSYNVSYAARYGDVGLFICIIIGINILQRTPVLKGMLATPDFQYVCAGVTLIVFIGMLCSEFYMFGRGITRQFVDIYHNVIVLPLFVYLLIALVPLTMIYGNQYEIYTTLICLGLWAILVFLDHFSGRLRQREWLIEHNFDSIFK